MLWERTQPILHAVPETNWQGADPGELSGALKLDNVSFRYGPDRAACAQRNRAACAQRNRAACALRNRAACAQRNRPLVLDGLTLEAKPGEFIGITGPSGSGKSTIVRLLLGFEKPTSGVVMYDGRDLATLDIAAVRGQLGVVLQNSRLMGGSLWEIIAGGAIISIDEAWEAAAIARLAADISEMPMGMHTVISEGGGNLGTAAAVVNCSGLGEQTEDYDFR